MKIILSCWFILLTSISIGQVTFNARVIHEENGTPIIGATVLSLSDLSLGTITDLDGKFTLETEEDITELEVLITYIGFEEKQVTLVVADELIIRLNEIAYEMDVVVVSSIKVVAEEFVHKSFNKLDIYQNPSSRADPVRAVNSLPSSTNVDETANLSLRGSSPFETGYLLNEVPIHDAFRLDQSNGVGQFSIFNTSIISKVDVYPSNPPLEFGNASSGLVSIYTDDASGTNSNSMNLTMAGLGLNITREFGENNSLVAYGNFTDDLGFKALNSKAFEDIIDFRSFDAGLYSVLRPKDHTSIKFFNYFLKESYTFNFSHPSFIGHFDQRKIKNLSILNLQRRFSFLTIDINQGFDLSRSDYNFGNIKNDIDETNYYGSINLTRFSDHWSLKLGSSWDLRTQKAQGLAPIFFFALAPNHPTINYSQRTNILNPESFFYGKYNFGEKWTVGGGLRYRKKQTEELSKYLSAQMILSFKQTEYQRWNLGLGTYNKLTLPDGEINVTQIINSDHLSLDYHLRKQEFKFDFSLYAKNTNYVDQKNKIKGVELFAHWENQRLATSLSLSSISSKIHKDDLVYDSKHDLAFFVRQITKLNLSSLWEFSSVITFREGAYFVPVLGGKYHLESETYQPFFEELDRGLRLKNYFTWDLNTSKIFPLPNGSLITFISASNLLNTQNESGELFDKAYNSIGSNYFNKRVVFVGCVFNW